MNNNKSALVDDFAESLIESAACLVAALPKLGSDLDWTQTSGDL